MILIDSLVLEHIRESLEDLEVELNTKDDTDENRKALDTIWSFYELMCTNDYIYFSANEDAPNSKYPWDALKIGQSFKTDKRMHDLTKRANIKYHPKEFSHKQRKGIHIVTRVS